MGPISQEPRGPTDSLEAPHLQFTGVSKTGMGLDPVSFHNDCFLHNPKLPTPSAGKALLICLTMLMHIQILSVHLRCSGEPVQAV